MAKVQIARPEELSEDKREELRLYLIKMWQRALDGRAGQVDGDYARWSKVYAGTPLEKERTVPFYKASNVVVQLTRIYIDTFVARTLNIIFATKPLYVVDGLPKDLQESWEYYLNRKALYNWNHYKLARELCFRGVKNGSVVLKTVYSEVDASSMTVDIQGNAVDETYSIFSGPETRAIPFEDFYVYPTVAEDGSTSPVPWKDVIIKFHRLRYPEETAKRMAAKGDWTLKLPDAIDTYLSMPRDVKAMDRASEANVLDPHYLEFEAIECHLSWAITNDSLKMYDIVALIHPKTQELIDVYFSPYPKNLNVFTDYRPYPREGLWYGESLCEILGQAQEEASVIHNDRRNNSFISNAVCFKRRNGSLLPNPSTNWYPGKVWDLESMDDLDVISIGRTYEDMLPQEDYVFGLADRLSGIGRDMQGTAQGQEGTRGVYNTMGTLSVMAEGNQRQDTNIRDVRETLGSLIDTCSRMQARWGSDDPTIDTLEPDVASQIKQALKIFNSRESSHIRHEVRASNAGANSEVRKASLLQMSQVIGQYGATVQQLGTQLLSPGLAPGLRMMINDVMNMQAWMAKRLLREFGEADAVEVLPDVAAAIEASIPGGSAGTKGSTTSSSGESGDGGGSGETLPPVSGQQLANAASLPGQVGGRA
jgi:hypothetical protein